MDTTRPSKRKQSIVSRKAQGTVFEYDFKIPGAYIVHSKHYSENTDNGFEKLHQKMKQIIFHVFLHDAALLILIYAKKLKGKGNIFSVP